MSWDDWFIEQRLPSEKLSCVTCVLQEPTLCFPFRYVGLLGRIPNVARPLVPVKPAKKTDYLALANLILTKAPSQSSARSVEFLVSWFKTCVWRGNLGAMHAVWTSNQEKVLRSAKYLQRRVGHGMAEYCWYQALLCTFISGLNQLQRILPVSVLFVLDCC